MLTWGTLSSEAICLICKSSSSLITTTSRQASLLKLDSVSRNAWLHLLSDWVVLVISFVYLICPCGREVHLYLIILHSLPIPASPSLGIPRSFPVSNATLVVVTLQSIRLSFNFPFYGHDVTQVTVATGGERLLALNSQFNASLMSYHVSSSSALRDQ